MQLYGLIFLGSANVFASLISASIIFISTSSVVPLAILLWRGRKILPQRYFRIPEPWGTLVDITAVAWVAFVNVVACFPITYPATLVNMNWISVVAVALVVFVLVLWFTSKRGVFRGPKADYEKMRLRREEAMGITSGGEVVENGNLVLRHERI